MEAQKILSDNWSAVQALATKLLKHRTLDGGDIHCIIWQTIGYPDADWRFGALNLP
jgi:ATP-dependent Zn protease